MEDPNGSHLPWKTLNRLRIETGRKVDNMKKWRIKEDGKCQCGEEQDEDHLFTCLLIPIKCSKKDCMSTTKIAAYWKGKDYED